MARYKNITYENAFSKHVREVREYKDLTLDQVGIRSELGLHTIEQIENRRGNVTISTLLALAKGLNVHPQELLNFDHRKLIKKYKAMDLSKV